MRTIYMLTTDGEGNVLGVLKQYVHLVGIHPLGMYMFKDDEGVFYVAPSHVLGMEVPA